MIRNLVMMKRKKVNISIQGLSCNQKMKRFGMKIKINYVMIFRLDSVEEYDYAVVSFESSEGLRLSKDKGKRIEYNKKGTEVTVDFSLDAYCTKDDIVLDYDKAKFQKIKMNIDSVYEDKVVQEEQAEISVYPTEYGTFMSKYGDIFAYDGYLTYLYENSLITENELKEACKSVTELECVSEEAALEVQSEAKKQSLLWALVLY